MAFKKHFRQAFSKGNSGARGTAELRRASFPFPAHARWSPRRREAAVEGSREPEVKAAFPPPSLLLPPYAFALLRYGLAFGTIHFHLRFVEAILSHGLPILLPQAMAWSLGPSWVIIFITLILFESKELLGGGREAESGPIQDGGLGAIVFLLLLVPLVGSSDTGGPADDERRRWACSGPGRLRRAGLSLAWVSFGSRRAAAGVGRAGLRA